MANKKFLLGILAITLVFGMLVVGCDDDDDGPFDIFRTSTPSDNVLSSAGITKAQYDTIKDAAGGYEGWYTEEEEGAVVFIMAWSGRNSSNFTSVANVMRDEFTEVSRVGNDALGFVSSTMVYALSFYPDGDDDDIEIPANTLVLVITGM